MPPLWRFSESYHFAIRDINNSEAAFLENNTDCVCRWRHFQRRAHPLSHLDIIDRSSRGPWGSFQLLYRLGRANIVISLLAIITILSLVIGPSVQQVLETRTRQVKLDSAVAKVAYATKYTTRTGAANGYFGCKLMAQTWPWLQH